MLRPSIAVYKEMVTVLSRCDLAAFPFAEQDFLNQFFKSRWTQLPWTFNASKALFACHRNSVWDFGAARNLHFTMAKPWDLKHPCHKGYESLNQLWWAAFAAPETLCRVLLQVTLQEKRRRAAHSAVRKAESFPSDSEGVDE